MKKYKLLYNLDMSGVPQMLSKERCDFAQPLSSEHIKLFAQEVLNTGVDAFFCCPTLFRLPLWNSEIEPHWKNEAIGITPPTDRKQWTSSERCYFPMREYILNGGNPIEEIYTEVKKSNTDFFFSFRMNDWHFVEFEDSAHYPTLGRFYISHPEYRIKSSNNDNPIGWDLKNKNQSNFLIKEVRNYCFGLLSELCNNYDIDGLELDFMRSPNYFPLENIVEGGTMLTDFIREIRKMLDSFGNKRNKSIPLCVRLPHRFDYNQRLGFDVKKWVDDKLVQMINVSTSYIHSNDIEIETYKKNLPNALIYAEEQMVLNNYINSYGWPAERRTPKEILETSAYEFKKRGADGISLFNFFCTREIEQPNRDPDSIYSEPPLKVLSNITNDKYLNSCNKHYFIYGYNDLNFGEALPSHKSTLVTMKICANYNEYKSAKLRVVCTSELNGNTCNITVNGHICELSKENGELFTETVHEGQFPQNHCVNANLPMHILNEINQISINFVCENIEIFGIEIALYKE